MKSLAILGAGGHGKVVADAAYCAGKSSIVFFDNEWPHFSQIGPWDVVGNIQTFFKRAAEFDEAIVALGNNAMRLEYLTALLNEEIPLATIIHPRAVISPFASIKEGSVICAGAVVNPDAHVGIGNIINTGASVDHDCHLGDAVHVSPGAHLAGKVRVGDRTWIGIGAVVRQNTVIGKDVMVGAGAAVVCDLPDHCTALGVPAKPMHKERP